MKEIERIYVTYMVEVFGVTKEYALERFQRILTEYLQ